MFCCPLALVVQIQEFISSGMEGTRQEEITGHGSMFVQVFLVGILECLGKLGSGSPVR